MTDEVLASRKAQREVQPTRRVCACVSTNKLCSVALDGKVWS